MSRNPIISKSKSSAHATAFDSDDLELIPQLYFYGDINMQKTSSRSEDTIYFDLAGSMPGTTGVPMRYLLNPKFTAKSAFDGAMDDERILAGMNNAEIPTPLASCKSVKRRNMIQLMIRWPTDPTLSVQCQKISLLEEDGHPISHLVLAIRIAIQVRLFIKTHHSPSKTIWPGSERWAFGEEPEKLKFEDLWLMSIFSVREDYFQADIACQRKT